MKCGLSTVFDPSRQRMMMTSASTTTARDSVPLLSLIRICHLIRDSFPVSHKPLYCSKVVYSQANDLGSTLGRVCRLFLKLLFC